MRQLRPILNTDYSVTIFVAVSSEYEAPVLLVSEFHP